MSTTDWEHEVARWIDTADWDAIEGEADIVGSYPALVDVVMVGYRRANTSEQRAAAVLALPDRFEPAWDAVLRDFLTLAPPEAQSPTHRAVCKALCMLGRDWSAFDRYWDTLEVAMERAQALAQSEVAATETHPPIVPGQGFDPVRIGMSPDDALRSLGPPSADQRFDWGERELCFDSRGLRLVFMDGRLITIRLAGPALTSARIAHPSRAALDIDVPADDATLVARWGEPPRRSQNTGRRPHTDALGYAGVTFHFHASTRELLAVVVC